MASAARELDGTRLRSLLREHEALRSNMADKLDKCHSAITDDVQDLKITVESLSAWRKETIATMDSFRAKLDSLVTKVESMSKAIDDATAFSYQYNLKILGVPQENERETVEKTAELCIRIFHKMEVEVDASDIDIAHRVSARNQHGRRRQSTRPIICKFVRRAVRESSCSQA